MCPLSMVLICFVLSVRFVSFLWKEIWKEDVTDDHIKSLKNKEKGTVSKWSNRSHLIGFTTYCCHRDAGGLNHHLDIGSSP